ncbi:cuticle protein 7 [Halyomorpha halys]|uniref:cuticle protein 7 n=1 Tax=Halyomorpha halys TaxID=286706 RepID=UPI0006D52189|nr:cuticle protein 7-like [Halyomorpha halys]KAE8573781.1 Cuticle Protein CPR RR-2 [Halyomorpha halys]
MIKFVVLAIAITAVHCQYGGYQKQEAEYKEEQYYDPPKYSFEYSVHDPHTGDIKSQKEERYGDKTQGYYSLVEPDGSQREVHYSVEGKSGFLAQVHKEPGKYKPAPEPAYYKPQPSYHQPQPAYQKPSYYH